ncbi:MAG TPA: WGR domain-containing protein, partial [Herpetosiphonaceae bacterium]
MSTREFHYQDGTSSKFWRITTNGPACTVQFGRIGTPGQTQTKTFPDAQAAQAESTRQIAEKLNKGYREIGAAQATTQNTSTTPAPSLLRRVAAAVLSRIAPGTAPQAQPSTPPVTVQIEPATAMPGVKPAARARKAAQPTEPPAYDPTVRLNLDPDDWFWATWRRPYPLKRPPATPFDRAETLQRLRHTPAAYEWRWNWENVVPKAMTPEEAIFWLHAMHLTTEQKQANVTYQLIDWPQIAEQLATSDTNTRYFREQAFALVLGLRYVTTPVMVALLATLFSPQKIMEQLIQAYEGSQKKDVGVLTDGFRQYVLPYLSQHERDQLSRSLTPYLKREEWHSYYRAHPAFYFAAMLGGHGAALLKLVQSWHDGMYSSHSKNAQEIIFGLDDPGEVEAQFRRLKLRLNDPRYIRAWIAHTEDRALDVVRASIQSDPYRESAAALTKTFALVGSPAAAPHMLLLTQESKAPQIAGDWLDAHPAHTIAGLLPVADGRDAQAKAATELLRRLVRRGYGAQIEQALAALPADVAARHHANLITKAQPRLPAFDEQTTPDWLAEALRSVSKSKPTKLPAWARPSELPPITADAHVLSAEQVEAVLRSVQRAKKDGPNALIKALKQHADRAALDHFVWSLFEEWLAKGASSKDNWAFFGLGVLGGDATAIKLTPLISDWPGESQHQRATNGLECLRMIGSDTALMQINSIAQKVKFKGIQKRAVECMNQIAEERGLSRAQLDDRIVPDCELDARGERVFDYGPRQFRFVLGPEMKPMLRDPEGKLKPNLPTPTAKDDAAKASQALAEWKLLKKQIANVASME